MKFIESKIKFFFFIILLTVFACSADFDNSSNLLMFSNKDNFDNCQRQNDSLITVINRMNSYIVILKKDNERLLDTIFYLNLKSTELRKTEH